MTNPANCSERQQLEHLFHQSSSMRLQLRLRHIFQSIGVYLMDALTRDRQAPRLWMTTNATGDSIWHSYDPMTHQSFSSASEQEMRSWLESRYYR